jgi:hypothetical protein
LTATGDTDPAYPDVVVTATDGSRWRLDIDPSPSRASPFIGPTPAAPSSNGDAVYWTHIGPIARPDVDFGEPTMWVIAALHDDGNVDWWSLPDGWQVVASDDWGTVLAKLENGRLQLALAQLGSGNQPSSSDDSPGSFYNEPETKVIGALTNLGLRAEPSEHTFPGGPANIRVILPDGTDLTTVDATPSASHNREFTIVSQRVINGVVAQHVDYGTVDRDAFTCADVGTRRRDRPHQYSRTSTTSSPN